MAKRKPSQAELRQFRHDVARLKAAGLVSKRVDARNQRMTRYMQEQVKRFQPVLKGEAKVLKAPKRRDKKAISETYPKLDNKGNAFIVPTNLKSARVNYSKKSGEISISGKNREGKTVRRKLASPALMERRAREAEASDRITFYRIQLGDGSHTFDSYDELVKFMAPYTRARRQGGPWVDWENYVQTWETTLDEYLSDANED